MASGGFRPVSVDGDVKQRLLEPEGAIFRDSRMVSGNLNVMQKVFEVKHDRALDSDEARIRNRANPLLISRRQWLGARAKMALFLIAGAGAGIGHHVFYATLDGRSAEDGIFTTLRSKLHATLSDQSLVNVCANVFSKIGAQSLAAVVGIAFAQLFWARMIHRAARVREIDSLVALSRNPLDISSWAVVFSIQSLALVAASAALVQLIEVLAPGALTIAPVTYEEPCSYDIVDLYTPGSTWISEYREYGRHNVVFFNIPSQATYGLIARVLMAGTYIPPQRRCQSCEYNVTYVGPAVQCKNATQISDFTALTALDDPHAQGGSTQIGVWAARTRVPTLEESAVDSNFIFEIQSRNIVQREDTVPSTNETPIVALHCTGWIAEYKVNVRHNITSTATLLNVTRQHPFQADFNNRQFEVEPEFLSIAHSQVWGIWLAFYNALNQDVAFSWMEGATSGQSLYGGQTLNALGSQKPWLPWSVLGRGSGALSWQWPWPGDLEIVIPALMENISLSLLSGSGVGLKVVTNTTTCRTTTLRYVYYRARLLGTYGATFTIAFVLLVAGYSARRTSSRSETLDFSRTLAAYPIDEQLMLDDHVVADANGVLHRCQPERDESLGRLERLE